MSRREAASLLGYASEFNVRRLEQEGTLHAVRGAMGQAWYSRQEVLDLRLSLRAPAATPAVSGLPGRDGRWSDADLVSYLRREHLRSVSRHEPAPGRRPSLADMVADCRISIARAQKVYRFWTAHDEPSDTEMARARHPQPISSPGTAPDPSPAAASATSAPTVGAPTSAAATPDAPAGDRRRPERLQRDMLIRRLRDPDPQVRARAFESLKPLRR